MDEQSENTPYRSIIGDLFANCLGKNVQFNYNTIVYQPTQTSRIEWICV